MYEAIGDPILASRLLVIRRRRAKVATLVLCLCLFSAGLTGISAVLIAGDKPTAWVGANGMLPLDLYSMLFSNLLLALAVGSLLGAALAWLARGTGLWSDVSALALGVTILILRPGVPFGFGGFAAQLVLLLLDLLAAALLIGLTVTALSLARAGGSANPTRAGHVYWWLADPKHPVGLIFGATVAFCAVRIGRGWLVQDRHVSNVSEERANLQALAVVRRSKFEACQSTDQLAEFCGGVYGLGVSHNGKWLATVSRDGVTEWNLASGRLEWRKAALTNDDPATQLLTTDDGRIIVSVDGSSAIAFDSGGQSYPLERCNPDSYGGVAAFSPDERQLSVASVDVCVYDTRSWEVTKRLDTQCFGSGVAYLPAGDAEWVSCGRALRRFELPSGKLAATVAAAAGDVAERSDKVCASVAPPSTFEALQASPDGQRIITIGSEQGAALKSAVWEWDAKTGRPLRSAVLEVNGLRLRHAAWSRNQVALEDFIRNGVLVFDASTGALKEGFGKRSRLAWVTASSDGSVLFGASNYGDEKNPAPTIVRCSACQ